MSDDDEDEHVPTVDELAKRGMALPGAGNRYQLTPEGQELIYAAMSRNATRRRNRR